MSQQTRADETTAPRWRLIGPGLVVAATGVGAADLVATLIAGSKYGYLLLWCAVLGCVMKIVLVEGAGRYSLATGRTIFEGWRSLGHLDHVVLRAVHRRLGLRVRRRRDGRHRARALRAVRGALGHLVGHRLRPDRPRAGVERPLRPVREGARRPRRADVRHDGRRRAVTLPNLPDLLNGLVPRIPDGGLVNVLALAGGVGGTITLAAYGYWLREKGWITPRYMRVMRIDNSVAYVVTGLFVVATLIVGAELLYSANIAVPTGDKGMLDLSNVLADRYGTWMGKLFLVGFWAAAMSSLVGVWNGVSLMFADFMGNVTGKSSDDPDSRAGGRWYKAYILWLTFPPMVMLFLGEPVWLILAYGVLGAFFMPFLAVTLLWLLNTDRTPAEWRNKIVLQRRDGAVHAGLRRARGQRDPQGDRR